MGNLWDAWPYKVGGGGTNEWTGCFNMANRSVNKGLRSTCTFTNMIYWKSEIGKMSSDGIRLSIFGYGNTPNIQMDGVIPFKECELCALQKFPLL